MAKPFWAFSGIVLIFSIYFLPWFDTPLGKLTLNQYRNIGTLESVITGGSAGIDKINNIFFALWIIGAFLIVYGILGKESVDKW